MNETRTERSAYKQIVELCYEHGIISSPCMTEADLYVVLDSLCSALVTPRSREREVSEYQRSEQDTHE